MSSDPHGEAPADEPASRRLTLHPVESEPPGSSGSRELGLAATLEPERASQLEESAHSALRAKLGASSIASVQIQQDSSASMVDGEQRLLVRAFTLRQRIEQREADARKRRRMLVGAGAASSVLFVAFLVAVVFGAITVRNQRNDARDEREALSRALLEETMDTVAAELELQFRPVHGALMTSLRWAEAGSLDSDDPAELNRYFMPLLAEIRAASSLLRADTSGNEYMLLSQGESWRTRSTVPGQLPTLREWSLAGELGKEWQADEPYDPHQRPWYLGGAGLRAEAVRARSEGRMLPVAWTEPYEFFITGELGISLSAPATSVNGRAYVLAFDVKLGALSELTARLPEDFEAGQVFVLDDKLRVLGLPREVGAETSEQRAEYWLTPMAELDVAPISQAAFVEWQAKAEAGEEGPWHLRLGDGEELYWVGVRRLESMATPPVWIGVVVPEAGFIGP